MPRDFKRSLCPAVGTLLSQSRPNDKQRKHDVESPIYSHCTAVSKRDRSPERTRFLRATQFPHLVVLIFLPERGGRASGGMLALTGFEGRNGLGL
jgi:hypothetical protein